MSTQITADIAGDIAGAGGRADAQANRLARHSKHANGKRQ